MPHFLARQTRRDFLRDAFCGFGSLALPSMLHDEQLRRSCRSAGAEAAASTGAKAKSVIFLFMAGGPSHLDTFDPKPLLEQAQRPAASSGVRRGEVSVHQARRQAARLPAQVRQARPERHRGVGPVPAHRQVHRRHRRGALVSWRQSRSLRGAVRIVHAAASCPGFPSMGSWVVYGLGSESRSLPGYVVMPDPHGALEAGQPMYSQRFPAGGLSADDAPQRSAARPQSRSAAERVAAAAAAQDGKADPRPERGDTRAGRRGVGGPHLLLRSGVSRCRPRPRRCSTSRGETKETLDLYGVGTKPTDDYGRRCLLARRLVEKGVRFVVVVSGGGPGNMQWDAHKDIDENHQRMAAADGQAGRRAADGPEAARPARFDAGALGRRVRPFAGSAGGQRPRPPQPRLHDVAGRRRHQGRPGRRRHRRDRPACCRGAVSMSATFTPRSLHQLGLDQDKLTFPHLGREERLTLVLGKVIEKIV